MFANRLISTASGSVDVMIGGDGPVTFVSTHPFQAGDGEPGSLATALADVGRTVWVLPRGMGSSTAADASKPFIEQLVLDLEDVRSALDVETWVVVGQSAGGYIAMAYASRFASSTAGLILSCTAATSDLGPGSVYHPENPDNATAVAALMEGRRDVLSGLIAHRPSAISSVRSLVSASNQAAFLADLRTIDLSSSLDDLAVATLVIVGKYDRAIPPEHGREIARRIPTARLVEFEYSGHFPYDEEPDRFREVVAGFVESLTSDSSASGR